MSDPFDDYMTMVEGIVADSGWLLQSVMADPQTTPPSPGYTYTVGFGPTLNHPEMCIFGVSPDTAGRILNDLGDRIEAGVERFDGEASRRTGIVRGTSGDGLPVWITPVPRARYADYFGVGNRYYRDHDLGDPQWFQIIWSDVGGRLPWERGFDREMSRFQPILGPTPVEGS